MLIPWKKNYEKPRQCIKKQRRHFVDKVHIVKAMIFPVVVYGCESWTKKKTEHQRIDAFELWCWRRLLRVPWTARRTKQSILKEINPECSLEGLMLMLKLQYSGHLMWRASSLEKILIMGKSESKKRRGHRMRWYQLSGHEFEQTPGDSRGQEPVYYSPWDCKESDRT